MIRLDVSTTSVVVKCSECPHWYAFAWTRDSALTSAENHKINVHGIPRGRAVKTRALAAKRHADTD